MDGYTREIPPEFGGIVTEPNVNDVLSGRGGRINSHPGNVYFRELVNQHKYQYLAKETAKLDKAKIADRIVRQIRNLNPPGRFLKEVPKTSHYVEIGDEKARKKAGQAMREKAPETRKVNEEMQHQNQQTGLNPMYQPFSYGANYMHQSSQGYPGAEQTYPSFSSPSAVSSSVSTYSTSSTMASYNSYGTQNPTPYATPQSPYPDHNISEAYSQTFPVDSQGYSQMNQQSRQQNHIDQSIASIRGAAFDMPFNPLRSSESSSATDNSLNKLRHSSTSSNSNSSFSFKTQLSSSSNATGLGGSPEPTPMASVKEQEEPSSDDGGNGDDEASVVKLRHSYLPSELKIASERPNDDVFADSYTLKRTLSDPELSSSNLGASLRWSYMDSAREDSMNEFLQTAGFGEEGSQELNSPTQVGFALPAKTSSSSSNERPPRFKMERATSGISDFSMGSAASRSGQSSGASSWLNNIPYDPNDKLLNGSSRSILSEISADMDALDLAVPSQMNS